MWIWGVFQSLLKTWFPEKAENMSPVNTRLSPSDGARGQIYWAFHSPADKLSDTTLRRSLLRKLKLDGPFRKIKKCYWTCFSSAGKGKKKKKDRKRQTSDSNESKSWMRRASGCHLLLSLLLKRRTTRIVPRGDEALTQHSGKEPEKGGRSRTGEGREHLQGGRVPGDWWFCFTV